LKQALIAEEPLAGGLYVAGGDEVLNFMRDAVLSLSPRATGANALTCEPLGGQSFWRG